jgi:N-acetyl-gamma-glutamyl-phosphate reductase
MKNKIRVGIIGGAGYTGGELIRLLINHPSAEMIYIHSKSNAGKKVQTVHHDLVGVTDIGFTHEMSDEIDVLFLCVGHGDSLKFLQENEVPKKIKIISLSQDFRLKEKSVFKDRQFVYGIPEVNSEQIKKAENVANPGCFAIAIEMGLLPLAKMKLLQDVFTTGITGSTGAGQSLSPASHFSWRENNVQAYKTLTHQHLHEINQTLNQLSEQSTASIHFVPWRGDFTRGIFVTSQIKCNKPLSEIYEAYEEFYNGHPFVKISSESIFLKQVVNTNNCFIHLEKESDILVVHSVIDNLLKGASGQAVQNMNLMFGVEETEGLRLKANYF